MTKEGQALSPKEIELKHMKSFLDYLNRERHPELRKEDKDGADKDGYIK